MATALIIGASRGIGLEFVRQYRTDGWEVIGTARDDGGMNRIAELGARPARLDVNDPGAPEALEAIIGPTELDVVIYSAGVQISRTKALEPPAEAEFDQVMRTNVLAAMRLCPVAGRALAPAKGRLAVMSSRMGSIGLRNATNSWLYRASKAALNSVLADMALVLGPEGVTCTALNPGWVRTDMGRAGALIDVATSVSGMRSTLAALQPAQNGSFLQFDGTPLAW